MKPFARINLSSAALRRGILVLSLALAAAGCCVCDVPSDAAVDQMNRQYIRLDMRVEQEGEVIFERNNLVAYGKEECLKTVTEHLYPTDYDVEVSDAGQAKTVPKDFAMRESGVVVNVRPMLTVDGLVDVELDVSVIDDPEWKECERTIVAANGESYTLPVEEPYFHVRTIKGSFLCVMNQPMSIPVADDTAVLTITPRAPIDEAKGEGR